MSAPRYIQSKLIVNLLLVFNIIFNICYCYETVQLQ